MKKLLITLFALLCSSLAICSDKDVSYKDKVVIVPIKGAIVADKFGGQETRLIKAFEKIEKDGAKLVIVEIDSPGGAVDTCDKLSDIISKLKIPTIALPLKQAVSGGAMMATACKEIVMVKGSRIGDIQPMQMFASEGMDDRTAEKIEADVRAIMGNLAEMNGHSPRLLHAMVSRSIALYRITFKDGKQQFFKQEELDVLSQNIKDKIDKRIITNKEIVIAKGKLLHMTSGEAVKYGLATGIVDSRKDFYAKRKIDLDKDAVLVDIPEGKFGLVKTYESIKEEIRKTIGLSKSKMMLLAIFLILGIAGTLTEMHMPGFGIPGAFGIIGFAGFFAILFMDGTAQPWEIGLFVIGIILLVVEIVVLPGFGVAGGLGVCCILGALFFAILPEISGGNMEGNWAMAFETFILLFGSALFLSIALTYLFVIYGSKLPIIQKAFLESTLKSGREVLQEVRDEVETEHLPDAREVYLGKSGYAITPLRPSGRVKLDSGETIDVVSTGDLIIIDTRVKVVEVAMNRIVVDKL